MSRGTFARAWYKLTHRDMARVPVTSARSAQEDLIWQDPPRWTHVD
jgi:catalase (peroxidase I)